MYGKVGTGTRSVELGLQVIDGIGAAQCCKCTNTNFAFVGNMHADWTEAKTFNHFMQRYLLPQRRLGSACNGVGANAAPFFHCIPCYTVITATGVVQLFIKHLRKLRSIIILGR